MNTKMVKLISLSAILSMLNTPLVAEEVNCEAAVKNGIKLMKAKMEAENPGKSNMFLKAMSSPKSIARGIKKCETQIKNPELKKVWACQEKATSADALKACEK